LSKDLFTFSIQEAETLGIECAIVLAAAKDINTSSSTSSEIAVFLKDRLIFLGQEEILLHVNRLLELREPMTDLIFFYQPENYCQATLVYKLFYS